MARWSANVNVMIRTLRRVGRSLARDFNEINSLQSSLRGTNDFTVRAQIRAGNILQEQLNITRVNYGLLMRDRKEYIGQDPTRRWICDPLSGIINFSHALPQWAISLALEHKGEIVAGVIYAPINEDLFFAEKGNGAWLNDRRMRVSGRRTMADMVFSTTLYSKQATDRAKTLQEITYLMSYCDNVRIFNAPALDLAYLAAGRYDGYWGRGFDPTGLAAGLILLKEAGGLTRAIAKQYTPFEDASIIATTPKHFERLIKILQIDKTRKSVLEA